jgi:Beta-1,3-glucanase
MRKHLSVFGLLCTGGLLAGCAAGGGQAGNALPGAGPMARNGASPGAKRQGAPPSCSGYKQYSGTVNGNAGVPIVIYNHSGLPNSQIYVYAVGKPTINTAAWQYLETNGSVTSFTPSNAAPPVSLACFPGSIGKNDKSKPGANALVVPSWGSSAEVYITLGTFPTGAMSGASKPAGAFTAPVGWTKGQPGYTTPWDQFEYAVDSPSLPGAATHIDTTQVNMMGLPLTIYMTKGAPENTFGVSLSNAKDYAAILKAFQNSGSTWSGLVNQGAKVGKIPIPRILAPLNPGPFDLPAVFNPKYMKTVLAYYADAKNKISFVSEQANTVMTYSACSDGKTAFYFSTSKTCSAANATYTFPIATYLTDNDIFQCNPATWFVPNGTDENSDQEYYLLKDLFEDFQRGVMVYSMPHQHPIGIVSTKDIDLYYPKGGTYSTYSAILHQYMINNAAYGFAFDDAAGQSTSMSVPGVSPFVTITIGKLVSDN